MNIQSIIVLFIIIMLCSLSIKHILKNGVSCAGDCASCKKCQSCNK